MDKNQQRKIIKFEKRLTPDSGLNDSENEDSLPTKKIKLDVTETDFPNSKFVRQFSNLSKDLPDTVFFSLTLGESTQRYECSTHGNSLVIKNISDLTSLQRYLRVFIELNPSLKSQPKTLSKPENDLQENYLTFNILGYTDKFQVSQKLEDYQIANSNDYDHLLSTVTIFLQNHKSLTQEQYHKIITNFCTTLDADFKKRSFHDFTKTKRKIYFAGGLFTNKDLIGNMFLANAIERISDQRYQCILPQDQQQMASNAEEIKDNDLRNVRDTDGIQVNFDGTELDSGTVVEFMASKFLNKPAVVYRTDYRSGGDHNINPIGENWNLMQTNYPRTEIVRSIMIMDVYQNITKKYKGLGGDYSLIIAREVSENQAQLIVAALDRQFNDSSKSFIYYRKEEEPFKKDMALQVSGMTKMYNHCLGIGMERPAALKTLKKRYSVYNTPEQGDDGEWSSPIKLSSVRTVNETEHNSPLKAGCPADQDDMADAKLIHGEYDIESDISIE